ncbi:Cytidylate kinase [Buchnera aphidicola (Phyllaphis fagi)]
MNLAPVITIDGLCGSGKSGLCQALSRHLNWFTLESGMMYRILACLFLKKNIPISEKFLTSVLNDLDHHFIYKNGFICNIINKNFSKKYIMSKKVTNTASKLATFVYVRNYLFKKQKLFRQLPGLVANGRDMGTVVFPDAIIKFFLEATLENRVSRRLEDFKNQGYNFEFHILLDEMKKRDERDQNRQHSPLKMADNAIILDSNNITFLEVVQIAIKYINQHDYFKD